MQTDKRFDDWIKIKRKAHFRAPFYSMREGDVWWAEIGENVGVKINGKNEFFSRPILILKIFNKYSFLAVPLTSKRKKGSWYVEFQCNKRVETAVLSQIRVLSVHRLLRKIGVANEKDKRIIRKKLIKLLKEKMSPSITTGVGINPKYTYIVSNLLKNVNRKTRTYLKILAKRIRLMLK